jgi:lipoyl(octanoyl) transferase
VSQVLQWTFLGTVDYRRALELQLELRDEVAAGRRADILLLLEHSPVITLGRSAQAGNVLLGAEALAQRGVDCVRVERGGDVTYHGPGQLVGYPIRKIGRAVRPHVEGMCAALRAYLGGLGIESWWDDEAPGLWTASGKIAAVGVDARGGVTTHGFALNLRPKLQDYAMIVPCGMTKPVVSVESLKGEAPSVAHAAADVTRHLAAAYQVEQVRVEPAGLL